MSNPLYEKYDMTVGIECHVQLATETKLFSSSDNDARDREPNSVVNAIDFGLPGVLPVLNRQAIVLAVRAAAALNAEVGLVSRFDRKHYFYPDLPKGYQTTQLYHPIILEGYVEAPLEDNQICKVRIHHAHLEEDAGKLTHYGDFSLVDLNRAGTPLIEIVSEPDIHSAAEARAYAAELHKLMVFAGVTRGDLYHGNMRFDVNISVAEKGATKLGNRAEVKNLNSFKSIEKAAEYEFIRQATLLEKGERIVQETRGWNDDTQSTTSQRSKEDAQDYRYMPDPDIPPVILTDDDVVAMQKDMPMLPATYRKAWESMRLDASVTEKLLENGAVAQIVHAVLQATDEETGRRIANWFASSSADELDLAKVESGVVTPHQLQALSWMVRDKKLSSTGAKEVFLALFDENHLGKEPENIAEAKNLLQMADEGAIEKIVKDVLADPASAQSLADIKAGKDKAIGYLVGQIMKKSQGKANPALAQQLIKKNLE